MTSPPTRLAIDLGASSGRVIAGQIIDDKLQLTEVVRFDNAPVQLLDSLQWNLVELWANILEGLRIASTKFENICSIGVDTWGVDYVLIRRDGMVAGPVYNHRDARTRGGIDRMTAIVPADRLFDATGLQFMEINTLVQFLSDRKLDPSPLDFADGLLLIADYFHFLLTGVAGIESTNASTTQLLDPRDRTWRTDLIESFNLPKHLFTPVLDPGTRLSTILPTVTRQTGLPASTEVILPATHDTASAVLAVPVNDFAPAKPDWCYISCGTWSLMGVELDRPLIHDECRRMNYTNEGGPTFGGRSSTRLLKNIGGLWVIQQIRRELLRRGQSVTFAEMVDAARTAPPGVTSIDPDAPELLAPPDMIEAVHDHARRTGQPPMRTNAAMFRATFEGLAHRYAQTLAGLESLLGHRIATIHIVGGGCQNDLLCQLTADACGRPVVAGPVEATAIGNLTMQMIAAGDQAGIHAARQQIARSFPLKTYPPTPPQKQASST